MVNRLPGVGEVFGRYRIDEQVGMGGMGVVFSATDTTLGRRVALKVMASQLAADAEFRERFQREAATLARLDSPHVIRIFDHGEIDGFPYIATQFVGGGDLADLVRARGPLPLPMAVRVCAQVAEALHDAHRAGVIHRDIKPANVLLRDPDASELEAYLCDFGIAQTEAKGLTVTGGVAGTWSYLAPERVQGAPATPATDVYALGCLFHAAITGRAPYRGSDVEVAMAHVNQPVPQLPGDDPTTHAVNAVLARVLAKDPRQRPATAAEFRRWLLDLTPASGGTPTRAPRRARRRTPVVAALVTALAIGGVAGSTWWWQQRDDPDTSREAASEQAPSPSATPARVAAPGDLDDDGRSDLVFSVDLANMTRIIGLHSDGSTFERKPMDLGNGFNLLRADLDGDRVDELVTDTWVDEDHRTFRATVRRPGAKPEKLRLRVTARVENRGSQEYFGVDEASASTGDFDGDGDDDLLVAYDTAEGHRIDVSLNDGGNFGTFRNWLRAPGTEPELSLVPGDFDGDGDDDVAAVVGQGRFAKAQPRFRMFTSDGSGFAASGRERHYARASAQGQVSTTAGDFDGDGDDDLALVAELLETLEVSIFPGDVHGLGSPRTRAFLEQGSDDLIVATPHLTSGDYDGDGTQDLAIAMLASTWSEVWVLRGDGKQFGAGERWVRVPHPDDNYPELARHVVVP